MIASGVHITIFHSGKRWFAFSPDQTSNVYAGRSLCEAVGKLLVYLRPALSVKIEAAWSDHLRSIPTPDVVQPNELIDAMKLLPEHKERLRGRLMRILHGVGA